MSGPCPASIDTCTTPSGHTSGCTLSKRLWIFTNSERSMGSLKYCPLYISHLKQTNKQKKKKNNKKQTTPPKKKQQKKQQKNPQKTNKKQNKKQTNKKKKKKKKKKKNRRHRREKCARFWILQYLKQCPVPALIRSIYRKSILNECPYSVFALLIWNIDYEERQMTLGANITAPSISKVCQRWQFWKTVSFSSWTC